VRKGVFAALLVTVGITVAPSKIFAAEPAYLLFGEGGSVFLGCANCGEYESDSLNNDYGTYGSPYNSMSVRNSYGIYGSRYSDVSACNPNANNPPFLADSNGNFIGFVTVNRRFRNNIAVHPRLLRACQ
jgi:hypothetical protein